MVDKPTIANTLRDLFPFGEGYDLSHEDKAGHGKRQDVRAASPVATTTTVTVERGTSVSQKPESDEDVLSKESFERYRKRQISVNTKANFLHTVGNYLGLITTGLGSLAILAFTSNLPFVAPLIAMVTGNAIVGGGALSLSAAIFSSGFIPLAIGALAFGIVTLAIGQYNTRMNTMKNTDNTDWYQRRESQIVGKAIAKELQPYLQAAPRSDGKSWVEASQAQTAEQGQAWAAKVAPEAAPQAEAATQR